MGILRGTYDAACAGAGWVRSAKGEPRMWAPPHVIESEWRPAYCGSVVTTKVPGACCLTVERTLPESPESSPEERCDGVG